MLALRLFETLWSWASAPLSLFSEHKVLTSCFLTQIGCWPSLLVFASVISLVRLCQWLSNVRSLPPGPWGVPFFGYLPFMRQEMHLHFHEMSRRYGKLFSTKLGNQLVVVVSDHKLIRECFRREEFTGRPKTEFINILGGYGKFYTRSTCLLHQHAYFVAVCFLEIFFIFDPDLTYL